MKTIEEEATDDREIKAIEGLRTRAAKLLGKAMAREADRGLHPPFTIALAFTTTLLAAARDELGADHPVRKELEELQDALKRGTRGRREADALQRRADGRRVDEETTKRINEARTRLRSPTQTARAGS